MGGSGSGKSDLGISLARELDCEIFSIDSLCIYKHIDIASAKPSKEELSRVKHYGINLLEPNQHSNATIVRDALLDAINTTNKKTMLIVGGSGFYLSAIINGLSPMPQISQEHRDEILQKVEGLGFDFLKKIDPNTSINPKDSYRIQKALEIYFSVGIAPSEYFLKNPPVGLNKKIAKFAIEMPMEELRGRIAKRTEGMIESGIIDECQRLIRDYGRDAPPFKAIGIKECIDFIDGKIKNIDELKGLISTHTSQLAKRQNTFNRHQFGNIYREKYQDDGIFFGSGEMIYREIMEFARGTTS